VNNGIPQAAQFSSARIRVPLPAAGPTARWYLSPTLAGFLSMPTCSAYFFGYGNYVSSMGTLGFSLAKHMAIRGGYSLG
jgi:hypothetical protein